MSSVTDIPFKSIQWNLCCLCQSHSTSQRLQNSTPKGLSSLETDLLDLEKLEALPVNIDLRRMNDGSGIASTLYKHKAVYHKTCRSACNATHVKRARDKVEKQSDDDEIRKAKRLRSSLPGTSSDGNICVVCQDSCGELHKVKSMDVDSNLKKWSLQTKNFILHARLVTEASDAHAADIFYHLDCYTALRYAASHTTTATAGSKVPPFDPMVTAQLVLYMSESDEAFKLSTLQNLYQDKMSDLGRPCSKLNATRFKEHLLHNLPSEWSSFTRGKDVYLSHSSKVGEVLAQSMQQSVDQSDAIVLMKGAMLLRKYALIATQEPFSGTFTPDCLSKPVPESLFTFMNILLQGPKINMERSYQQQGNDAMMDQRTKVACSLSQLIIFNMVKHRTTSEGVTLMRHTKERETPFPLYVGIKMHSDSRLKHLVQTFHTLGLSVSYARVREVKLAVARSVCRRIEDDGVVLPTNMRSGVFTTGDFDNLDHKKTSNLSNDEFHGVAITLTNHLSQENPGVTRERVAIDPADTSKPKLPDHYVIVPPADISGLDMRMPRSENAQPVRPVHDRIRDSKLRDEAWIKHVSGLLLKGELGNGDIVTWSGFHSQQQDASHIKPPAEIGILPVFPDRSTDPALVKHVMLIVKKCIAFLNPGQTPVIGADQPLFAIAKQIQWKFPDILGEEHYVVLMGALHIEDKGHLMLGKFIRGSGWEWAMSAAGVFTCGRASSTLDDHHIKRTRYAHHVSLVALSFLKQEAYRANCTEVNGDPQPFDIWSENCAKGSPMFQYWSQIIELELLMCRFVRSLREGDFDLYVQVLDELCPWFFALDHTNYARWLPVHIKDLVHLQARHPGVYEEFRKGNFVVQRSPHKFSLMAKDQSHEHSNRKLQADKGGLSDLYDDVDAITLYMLAGPDTIRLTDEFEKVQTLSDPSLGHHEESPSLQERFITDVTNFIHVFRDSGNPFLESGDTLFAIDTRDVMDHEVVVSLGQMAEVGQALHEAYVQTRVSQATVPLSSTIPRNGLYTFNNRPDKKAKKEGKLAVLKNNGSLITQLFLSLQSRPDADMAEFFQYENQREPPSLADHGMLRSGTKSDILKCLGVASSTHAEAHDVTAKILDMGAVIHMVRPTRAANFKDYVSIHLVPYLKSQLGPSVNRIDAVWDTYPEQSLKMQAHLRRGSGPRTQIGHGGSTPIPKRDWQKYLNNVENKKELFAFCSEQLSETQVQDTLIITTLGDTVLSNQLCDLSDLSPCNHSEADSRIILHLAHAAHQGHTEAYVRTVDSDIVVLTTAFFDQLHLSKIWIGFGTGKNYRDIPIHDMRAVLGPSRSRALPLFHAFSGCDTTSQLLGCGKKSAWATWQSMPEITDVMLKLYENPESLTMDSEEMRQIERFCVLLYSKSCSAASVNEARQQLFSHGLRTLEALPPTKAALYQHVKRSILQACYIWKQATKPQQDIPNFNEWGWKLDEKINQWVPFWTALPDASSACSFLLHCGCQKSCQGNCKCTKAGIRCTSLCKCKGGCTNDDTG